MKATIAGTTIQDSPVSQYLFNDTRMAWIWLIVRLYVGWEWLEAGWHKLGDPAWVQTGAAILGFWKRAAAVPDAPAKPLGTFDWYRSFLQLLIDSGSQTWFGKAIAAGEFLVGIALIVGAFVGIAAVFGAFMNFNFMLAGSASTNPPLFLLTILLVLAWKTAGYYGVDRWLLVRLGTPWQPIPQRRQFAAT